MSHTADVDELLAHPLLPPALQQYMAWLAEQRLWRTDPSGRSYAPIDPAHEDSCVTMTAPTAASAREWTGSDDPAVYERLLIFGVTGGDGSRVAVWRDDDGRSQIVHLGSGSGSTMLGIYTATAIDFLRLLAIGYRELAFPDDFPRTPEQVAAEAGEAVLPAPEALRAWLAERFAVVPPDRASEIVVEVADMDADASDDPFWTWEHRLPRWQK